MGCVTTPALHRWGLAVIAARRGVNWARAARSGAESGCKRTAASSVARAFGLLLAAFDAGQVDGSFLIACPACAQERTVAIRSRGITPARDRTRPERAVTPSEPAGERRSFSAANSCFASSVRSSFIAVTKRAKRSSIGASSTAGGGIRGRCGRRFVRASQSGRGLHSRGRRVSTASDAAALCVCASGVGAGAGWTYFNGAAPVSTGCGLTTAVCALPPSPVEAIHGMQGRWNL